MKTYEDLEIELNKELHDKLCTMAEDNNISISQLISDIIWAKIVENLEDKIEHFIVCIKNLNTLFEEKN